MIAWEKHWEEWWLGGRRRVCAIMVVPGPGALVQSTPVSLEPLVLIGLSKETCTWKGSPKHQSWGHILGLGTMQPIQLEAVGQGWGEKGRPAREGKRERIDQELRAAGGRMNYDSKIWRRKSFWCQLFLKDTLFSWTHSFAFFLFLGVF